MTDIFKTEQAAKLLKGKTLLFLGGSVTRGLYKDLIWLLNSNTLLPRQILGQKAEESFPDFTRAEGEEHKFRFKDQLQDDFFGLKSGRDYKETREYINDDHGIKICFKFITEAWSEDISQWISNKEKQFGKIDIIIMNSCLWDVNRRGPTFKEIYEENLNKLVDTMKNKFPRTQLYWMTTPPISWKTDSRGMKLPGLHFQNLTSCFNVVEANNLAGEIMKKARINLIDVSFDLQAQTMRRNRDGIHWSPASNRLITNITLTHLTLTLPHLGPQHLPGRMKNSISLTNLIRRKMKRKRKKSSSRRSFEIGVSSNSFQHPYGWSPGSPSISFNYNSSGPTIPMVPMVQQYYPQYQYQQPHPQHYGQQYYGSPQFWPTPVQPQQRPSMRRERGAGRLRNRYHPYDPHYYY